MEQYKLQRETLLKEAFKQKYGDLQFTPDELKANEKFLELVKNAKSSLDDKFHFRPILYRDKVEPSTLYKFLRDMPKGCQQHSHNPCNLPSSWFVPYCLKPEFYLNEGGKLQTFDEEPKEGGWKNVLKLREEAQDKEDFDKKFENNFHFTIEDFDIPTISVIWEKFEFKISNRFEVVYQNEAMWEQYMTDTFLLAIDEGYTNFQIRNFIPFGEHKLFMDPEKEVQLYRRSLAKAQQKDPNFTIGISFSALRFFTLEKTKQYLDIAYELSKKHRDIIIGFDIVAEEVKNPADYFSPVFLEHRKLEKEEGHDLPLLLHGGECVEAENTNLYDLYLLDVKRIGHGLNLFKHPYLMPKIKEKGICIEVNPLSNQILRYVADLRLHPAIGYNNYGLKVSISSDDIGIFNLDTIWDFFCTAISFEFNLLDLKKVIVNSIETSCLEKSIQEGFYKDWLKRWDAFISKINNNQYV